MNSESLKIIAPSAGETIEVNAAEQSSLQFNFDLSDATFARDGNSLTIEAEGGTIRLTDYFIESEDANGLPEFVLEDGSVIRGEDFLLSMNPDLDISTAAGPSASNSSGGVGDYSADAGDLMGGVDRLDSADSVFWSAPEGASGADSYTIAATLTGAGAPGDTGATPPVTPPVNPPVTPPVNPPDPDPSKPHTAVKAALVGLGNHADPKVVLPLLDADGNRYDPSVNGYPDSITVEGLDQSRYNVVYDSRNGTITITLKDPAQPSLPENIVIKTPGDSVGYVVSVGTSQTEETADVTWPGLDGVLDPGTPTTQVGTWSGSTGNHMKGGDFLPDVSSGNSNIGTPAYASNGAEGKEFHWQLTDSSLSARADTGSNADKTASVNVGFGSGGGSFSISNESQVLDTVEHDFPKGSQNWGSYKAEGGEYEASLSATLLARGENTEVNVTVTNGEAIIKAGGETAPAVGSSEQARVSAINALDGGAVNVTADTVTVDASAAGFSDDPGQAGRYTVVTGVRSDGGFGSGYKGGVDRNSEVNLKGNEVNVSATITGDSGMQDHSQITYAAVAAVEHGQVDIDAGADGVTISVINEAEGEHLGTDGVYGISSGYGLGHNDMPTTDNFDNNYALKGYMTGLAETYMYQKNQGKQTLVNIESEGDVNVNVDLGAHDYHGQAAGIRTGFGDVTIKTGGNATVSSNLDGEHRGDTLNQFSAVSAGDGKVDIRADGDVSLKTDSNGLNNSVLHLDTSMREGGIYNSSNYGSQSRVYLSGQNVNLEGRAGYDGSALNNSIDGISLHHEGYKGYKHVNMTIDAEEDFTIDVSAKTNGAGSSTSATGVNVSLNPDMFGNGYSSGYENETSIGIKADKTEIKASIEHDGGLLPADTSATGVNASDTALFIGAYDGGPNGNAYDSSYPNHNNSDVNLKAVEEMSISATGGRYNTGINAESTRVPGNYYGGRVGVAAENLTIDAHGREDTRGDSHSYGVNVAVNGIHDSYQSADTKGNVDIQTGNLEINVSDANRAVGLRAEGIGAKVNVRPTVDPASHVSDGPLTVIINSTITGPEQLKGIAIEALNGGRVTINANPNSGNGDFVINEAYNNKIQLNGDVAASNDRDYRNDDGYEARVEILTYQGHDTVGVDGDVNAGYMGSFKIETENGNDLVNLGGVSATEGGWVHVNAGEGNDVIRLDGKVAGTDENGNMNFEHINIHGGDGNDLLVLSAPNSALFLEWYQGWLQSGGLNNVNCEGLIVQGVTDENQMSWLLDLAKDLGINVQLYGPDVNINLASDVSQVADLALNGDTANDVLYVRLDGSDSRDSAAQGDALANAIAGNSNIAGLESLLLDLVDGHSENSLNLSFLDNLLGKLAINNAGAKLILRIDQGDIIDFAGSGWTTGNTYETINGVSYLVYTKGGQSIYVETVPGGYSVSGSESADTYVEPQDPVQPEGPVAGDPTMVETAGSYTASNADKLSGFDYEHSEPSESNSYLHGANLEYTASVVAAAGAKGEETLNLDKGGKDVELTAGGGEPTIANGADGGLISGATGLDGAEINVTGKSVTVSASADGFNADPTRFAAVTGVRADGGLYDQYGDEITRNTQVNLESRGDVNASVFVTGDADTQSHNNITYAAVAATERGQVNISSAEGSVNINAENQASGDRISDGGTYGIFSGYGLTERDLPSESDFTQQDCYSDSEYSQYMQQMGYQNVNRARQEGTETKVTVNAAQDVNVSVNLGEAEHFGNASAVKASYGDVEINAGNDVNIGTTLNGEYRGDKPLSALGLESGAATIKAEGDVNISLKANGANLSVVDFQPSHIHPYGEGYKPTLVSGENVTISGEAGADGVAYHNHITGISAQFGNDKRGSFVKSNAFVVDADEDFTIDVSASHNGGSTEAVGVNMDGPLGEYSNYKGFSLLSNAEQVNINARVIGEDDRPLPQDSKTAGLSVNNGGLFVGSYDKDAAEPNPDYWGNTIAWDQGRNVDAMSNLSINAGGARDNYGIEVRSTGSYDNWSSQIKGGARAVVNAENLSIKVDGGANSGASSGYGVSASTGLGGLQGSGGDNKTQAEVTLKTNMLEIDVENTVKAVGLSADGRNSIVRIMGTEEQYVNYQPENSWEPLEITQDKPISVEITATVTGPGALNGIAVEAINGGMVSINGSTVNDSIILNGDVVVGTDVQPNEYGHYPSTYESRLEIRTDAGDDRIALNGDVSLSKGGSFRVDTGEGNDDFKIDGNVNLGKGGYFTVETGDGNDRFVLNGNIQGHGKGYSQFSVDTGEGDDLISINGVIGGREATSDYGYTGISINAGDGNDRIVLNGEVKGYHNQYSQDADYGNISISGGSGHDTLVLQAPDAATFEQWYKGWFENGGLGNVHDCESIVFYGLDADNLPQFVSAVISNSEYSNINFQVYSGDADFGYLQSLGESNSSMLYVSSDGLDSLGDGSGISDVHSILLDMADGTENDLGSLLSNVYEHNADADIYLKMDSADVLSDDWSKDDLGTVVSFKGEDYSVYSSDVGEDAVQLYVKLMTDV